ncbi:hypothetical protein BKI52_19370 [marine bacterium AO1-C]|nr:hypothetical protein BKI52_19370 [marine bacterium AO1-C]
MSTSNTIQGSNEQEVFKGDEAIISNNNYAPYQGCSVSEDSRNDVNSSGSANTNTQLNEVEAGRDINIYTTEIIPQEEEIFKDPTEIFTLREELTPIHLDEEALQKSLAEIDQERIIFLGGKSDSNVVDTLHHLIKKYQPQSAQEYRWLSFWGKNNAQRTIYLDSITEEAFPQNSLVAVEITQNKSSDTFLKSIAEISGQGAIEIKNILKKKNLVMICYFKGSAQIQTLTNPNRGGFGFHYWDTSPPINTLQEFIADFDFSKLYDEKHSVFKYILYVATFFPRTSPKEFKKIVDVLLTEKEDEILADTIREMDEKDEILKRTEKLKTRDLRHLWDQQTDDFFKECGLIIIQENDLQKVDFVDAQAREAYKDHFKSKMPFFLLEQFDNLINSGLPFATDTSAQVIEYFIQIACELARNDPYFYGTKLLQTVSDLFKKTGAEKITPVALKTFLIELIYAMLKLENVLLTEHIESFLMEHLDYRYRIKKASHHLLSDIIFELRSMEIFDKFHWMETMMTQGKKETKTSAYQLFFRLADSYKDNIQEVHTEFFEKGIKKWLLKGESITLWDQGEVRDSIKSYTISFIIDYWGFYNLEKWNILVDADPDFLVSWLFHPGLEIGYHNRSRHMGLREIRKDGSKQGSLRSVDEFRIMEVLDKARAYITENWFQKLLSLEEDLEGENPGNGPKDSEKYVALFFQYADTRQRNILPQEWARQVHLYWQQSNDLSQYDDEERNKKKEEILVKRRNLMKLKREFNRLQGIMPPPISDSTITPKSPPSNVGCLPFAGLLKKVNLLVSKINKRLP